MTLTLRIENVDTLENDGPLALTLRGTGCRAGRNAAMDWVLPDPSRHVSGHHFDIRFADGHYWVNDVSTNGTFIKGQRQPLTVPHRLAQGDRLIVGRYVIVVDEVGPATVQRPQAPTAGGPSQGVQTWASAPAASGAVSALRRAPQMPPQADRPPPQTPPQTPPQVPPRPSLPPSPPPSPDASAAPGGTAPSSGGLQRPPTPGAGGTALPQQPSVPQGAPMVQQPGPRRPEAPPEAPPLPERPRAAPATGAAQAGSGSLPPLPQVRMPRPQAGPRAADPPPPTAEALFRGFCDGAGLDPSEPLPADPQAFGRELGRCLAGAVTGVMQLLQDRARRERAIAGDEQTMRSVNLSNPLECLADPQEALAVLCLRPRDGVMTGPDGFAAALTTLARHQDAAFAALEPALAQAVRALPPDAAPADGGDGLIRAVLDAYAQAYARAARATPDR